MVKLLETSYIIYLLPSYHTNFDKRILKANKVYFTDVGLLSFLLKIKSANTLLEHQYNGKIFENFIIIEQLKKYYNKGLDPSFYYWQDSNKNEVDLIIEQEKYTEIYEIKCSSIPKPEYSKNLKKFALLARQFGMKTKAFLIYTGER